MHKKFSNLFKKQAAEKNFPQEENPKMRESGGQTELNSPQRSGNNLQQSVDSAIGDSRMHKYNHYYTSRGFKYLCRASKYITEDEYQNECKKIIDGKKFHDGPVQ
uniref:Uncharacterized protein n=1 Tax=Panagrolaimus superbus TaxID=310955 RepID=A0A914YGW1_9BILA